MKLLFCHDGPIQRDKLGEFYGIGFNDELFARYECISNDISIAMRVNNTNIEDKSNFLRLSKEKYNVIECPNMSSIKGIIFDKKKCSRILEKSIKECDMMIIRLPSFIGNIAVEIAKKCGKPYLVELVGCPWDALWNHSLVGKIVAPFMYLKTKKNVKNAKYVLYVTQSFLQRRYPTYGKSIGCSDVKLKQILVNEELKKRKEKISKMGAKMTLGTIGVLNIKYKGQEYVIRAISILKKLGYNIEYQMVGDGNNARLKEIARKHDVSENIKFMGTLKHNQIFNWLENIDVYIQPSKTEGLPRALVEAMSRGCPCIGTRVGGIPELLNEDFLVDKNDYIGLSKKIEVLINNSEIMKNEAENNFEISKKYQETELNKLREQFYINFLKGNKYD